MSAGHREHPGAIAYTPRKKTMISKRSLPTTMSPMRNRVTGKCRPIGSAWDAWRAHHGDHEVLTRQAPRRRQGPLPARRRGAAAQRYCQLMLTVTVIQKAVGFPCASRGSNSHC